MSAHQLHRLGLDGRSIHRRVKLGRLHPLYRGVFAVGHTVLSDLGRYAAGVLAGGSGAALSHRSAAALWGLRRDETRIEITVPRSRLWRQSGLVIHRPRQFDQEDVTSVNAIAVTTVARTLVDLAAVVSSRQLEFTLDRAERRDLLDIAAIDRQLSRSRGRPGAGALRRATSGWRTSDTRSPLEGRFQRLLREAGIPVPQTNVLVEGERYVSEVDCYWAASRLVVQLDGFAFHRTRRDSKKDADTNADLELAGNRVMRLLEHDIELHGQRTVRRLRAAMRTRGRG